MISRFQASSLAIAVLCVTLQTIRLDTPSAAAQLPEVTTQEVMPPGVPPVPTPPATPVPESTPVPASTPVPPAREDGDAITISDAQLSLIENTTVAAEVPARIDQVLVREGDEVELGQLLVHLRDDVVRAELRAAQAAATAAGIAADNDVDIRFARRSFEVRQKELEMSEFANQRFAGSVPESELNKLRLTVDQARLSIEQADHQRAIAQAGAAEKASAADVVKAKLARHSILSPTRGTIVEVPAKPGQWIDTGKPVIRIVSLDKLRVECFIDGRRYGSELVGKTVQFRPLGAHPNDPPAVGKVTFVSPELDVFTGQTRLFADLENRQRRMNPGMKGSLSISR
ncbi:MAG: HlyD family efflux transporter periplasmic adaptor subunit [Planctomycetota bacterium]